GIGPVGGHEDLDVSPGIKSIKLINNLKHSALDLIVTTNTIVKASTTDGIDFIKEDNASLLRSCHLEEFPNHAGPLTNILLN
ncbi:hypothetical protein L9G15_25345, partial [Shewanella sp. A3A]|nr:hypothetical protein [Shewanella ferrihydritica]